MLFPNMVPLEPAIHSKKRLIRPEDLRFSQSLEIVPLGFSEIVPASMWYPLFFGKSGDYWLVFAFLGTGGRNIFLNQDGTWKTGMIPALIKAYPFGIKPEGDNECLVLVDECFLSEEKGEPLFEDGKPTPFLENIKTELTEIARDLYQASLFVKEMAEEGLLLPINVEHRFSFGRIELKNAFTTNMKGFMRIKPEKLYHFNTKGYLALLFSQNFSLRNFALFEIYHSFEGQIFI